MSQSLRRPKERISVLIVTADNMTGELLTSAFARGRKDFYGRNIVGSSHDVIGELGVTKTYVALIQRGASRTGRAAGFKVLQKLKATQTAWFPLYSYNKLTPTVVDAFRQGARGIFCRTHCLKDLAKCIRMVHQGQIWASPQSLITFCPPYTNQIVSIQRSADGKPILSTRREEDVVRLVVDGLRNREIGHSLNVTEHSIRNYLHRIFDKLGVSTRVELILYTFTCQDRTTLDAAISVFRPQIVSRTEE